VEKTSEGFAGFGWDPKVRGTRVEDDVEFLGWGTDVDWSIVLGVHVVVDWDVFTVV